MNQQPAPIALPAAPAAAQPAAPSPAQGEADDAAWIEKARLVLRRSAGDPFTRQDAISKLRALYVKQRFGKTIGEESD